MSSVHAKLFEWHRVIQDIVAAEAELKDVERWPEADRDRCISEVMTRLTLLRAHADALLREIECLRDRAT